MMKPGRKSPVISSGASLSSNNSSGVPVPPSSQSTASPALSTALQGAATAATNPLNVIPGWRG
jgi:hypothetical protein